jgi:hypothetical protein
LHARAYVRGFFPDLKKIILIPWRVNTRVHLSILISWSPPRINKLPNSPSHSSSFVRSIVLPYCGLYVRAYRVGCSVRSLACLSLFFSLFLSFFRVFVRLFFL